MFLNRSTLIIWAAFVVVTVISMTQEGTPSYYIAKGLDLYCQAPQKLRSELRAVVAAQTVHRVTVSCVGDMENTVSW